MTLGRDTDQSSDVRPLLLRGSLRSHLTCIAVTCPSYCDHVTDDPRTWSCKQPLLKRSQIVWSRTQGQESKQERQRCHLVSVPPSGPPQPRGWRVGLESWRPPPCRGRWSGAAAAPSWAPSGVLSAAASGGWTSSVGAQASPTSVPANDKPDLSEGPHLGNHAAPVPEFCGSQASLAHPASGQEAQTPVTGGRPGSRCSRG